MHAFKQLTLFLPVSETDGGNCMVPNIFSNLTFFLFFFFFLQKFPLSLFLLIKHEDGEKKKKRVYIILSARRVGRIPKF